MTEADTRAAIVAEARAWIGTKWQHRAMIKGVAVDCAMLLVAAYRAAGVIPPDYDPGDYPRAWMFHQQEEKFLGFILGLGAKEVQAPGVGDIVLWKVGHCLSHAGIVSHWPFVIHAYARARQVQEDDLAMQGPLNDPAYPRRFFSFWAAR